MKGSYENDADLVILHFHRLSNKMKCFPMDVWIENKENPLDNSKDKCY